MTVETGQTLAHYRLVEKIGAGGMGEIWKATDTSLDRDVAIKVIPGAFASDHDRMVRFEREAKVLASLNHPCIAQVYGFHEADGVRFLAMELVQGEDLSQHLQSGPLSVEEAIPIARRMAQALEAAHETGIIHRDLKPANVILTPDGSAKVLDFGLAKIFQPDPSSGSSASISPTMTSGGTQDGVILGTAAYMSPEQARGKPLDRRSDIWSFGCVLYEMLTGRRLFRGETISDTIALILQSQPDWAVLPGNTPPRLRELLARCLEKDPRNRLRDIGDARIELERMISGRDSSGSIDVTAEMPAQAVVPRRGAGVLAGVFVAGILAGAGIWALVSSGGADDVTPLRVSIMAPDGARPFSPSVTPDGRAVVFYGVPEDPDPSEPEPSRLLVRPLDSPVAVPIPGTENASLKAISPDSRWIAYRAPVKEGSSQLRIYKAPLDGSAPPLALADWGDGWSEAMVWLPGGHILVATRKPISLLKIATDGSGPGEPIATDFDESVPEFNVEDILPDGVHVFGDSFTWEGQGYHDRVFALNVETGESRQVLDPASSPRWSPTGHLVFTRLETLLAIPFDPANLETTGGPVTLADGLFTGPGSFGGEFDLSPGGTLVHLPGGRSGSRRQIVMVQENDAVEPWSEDRMSFVSGAWISPDGTHLAATVMSLETLNYGVWVSELDRPRLRQWMAMPKLDCNEPAWHPDSRHLLYVCEGSEAEDEGIYIAPLDAGAPPRLLYTEQSETVNGQVDLLGIHPGGRHLLVHSTTGGRSVVLRVDLGDGPGPFEAEPLVPGRRRTMAASFSPDGRWVSYDSDDSGRNELFVAPFRSDGTVGPSTLVAATPLTGNDWIRTGVDGVFELVYPGGPESLLKVKVRTGSGIAISDAEPYLDLAKIRPPISQVTIQPDGRIVGVQEPEKTPDVARRLDLILNFSTTLQNR